MFRQTPRQNRAPSIQAPVDKTRIDVWEPSTLRYWSLQLGVSEWELEEAAKAVGPHVEQVENYLREHSRPEN